MRSEVKEIEIMPLNDHPSCVPNGNSKRAKLEKNVFVEDEEVKVTVKEVDKEIVAAAPDAAAGLDILSISADDNHAIRALARQYQAALPFPHIVLTDFLKCESLLAQIIDEIKHAAKVDYKESDLFKCYQSMDLSSLYDHHTKKARTSPLQQLLQVLYSAEWRRIVERILFPDHEDQRKDDNPQLRILAALPHIDCAVNCHTAENACHLLCHDDVIATRAVSFILYLVDEHWSAQDGGALELYDNKAEAEADKADKDQANGGPTMPHHSPCRWIIPKRNALCLFKVEPGVSFHSVQEVLENHNNKNSRKRTSPRLCLQGWYHYQQPDHGQDQDQDDPSALPFSISAQNDSTIHNNHNNNNNHRLEWSTLNQLKSIKTKPPPPPPPPPPLPTTSSSSITPTLSPTSAPIATTNTLLLCLSDKDRDFLAQYLDASYLQPKALQEMRARFIAESSLQLREFFLPQYSEPLKRLLEQEHEHEPPQQSNTNEKPLSKPSKPPQPWEHEAFYAYGMTSAWTVQGPPHMQRFLSYQPPPLTTTTITTTTPSTNCWADEMGARLHFLHTTVLQSAAFASFLACITSLKLASHNHHNHHHGGDEEGDIIRRFRPGRDYTVAHYGLLLPPHSSGVLDATFVVCATGKKGKEDEDDDDDHDDDDEDSSSSSNHGMSKKKSKKNKKKNPDALWQSGDVGGFECYIEADDQGLDEEYQRTLEETEDEDDEGNGDGDGESDDHKNPNNSISTAELLSVAAAHNTLSLVFRDAGTMRFVKYLSHQAPSSRWDISMEYPVVDE